MNSILSPPMLSSTYPRINLAEQLFFLSCATSGTGEGREGGAMLPSSAAVCGKVWPKPVNGLGFRRREIVK